MGSMSSSYDDWIEIIYYINVPATGLNAYLPIHSAIVVKASIIKPFNYLYYFLVCDFRISNKICAVF